MDFPYEVFPDLDLPEMEKSFPAALFTDAGLNVSKQGHFLSNLDSVPFFIIIFTQFATKIYVHVNFPLS